MAAEHRRDVRYWSSQKAVLLNGGGAGSLGVITNLSNGGLCLAVIGSPRRGESERIDLKVNQGTFLCNVVSRGREGLHCQFDGLIDDPDMWKIFKFKSDKQVDERKMIGHWPLHYNADAHNTYDKNGRWRGLGSMSTNDQYSNDLARIYSEGCFVAREQIDSPMDALDATVDALNPYGAVEERDRWALGFKDAVRHMAKKFNPFG